MLYIVSGYMRSGTSMMMDALSAGMRPKGIPCEWSRERDAAMNRRTGDTNYKANESYREIPLQKYQDFNFPRQYDGSLIKVMSWGLAQMRAVPHKVVLMIRDPYEIAESYERMNGQPLTETVNGMKVSVGELEQHGGLSWRELYQRRMKQTIIQHETRSDCKSLEVVHYNKLLEQPFPFFKHLAGNVFWPLKPSLAADVVNPSRKRVGADVDGDSVIDSVNDVLGHTKAMESMYGDTSRKFDWSKCTQ